MAQNGKQLVQVDSPNGTQGEEPIWMVAEDSGSYRIEMRALEKDAASGRYEVRVEELRVATPDDNKRVAAQRARTEAVHPGSLSPETLGIAVKKFEEALLLWHQVGDRKWEADAQARQARSEGLRQVQLKMLSDPKRSHPAYWASFIQSGQWKNLAGTK